MNKKDIKIIHGRLYLGFSIIDKKGNYIPMNLKLQDYLLEKWTSFSFRYNIKHLRFTFGNFPEEHMEAIAICHPKDNFSRKIGRKIVENRIKEFLKNNIDIDKKIKSKIMGKEIYKYPWIYKLKR